MKRLICITGVILIGCVCISTLFSPQVTAEIQTQNTVQQSTVHLQLFVIKSENNRIVVYKKGENTPYITTDTLTSSLPKADITALEKGIQIEGEAKLKKSLEDYCS